MYVPEMMSMLATRIAPGRTLPGTGLQTRWHRPPGKAQGWCALGSS